MKTKTPSALRITGTLCLGIGLAGWIVFPTPGQNIDSKQRESPLKPLPATVKLPYICRDPEAVDYRHFTNHSAPLTKLPAFNAENPFSVDLRSGDASRLDLRNSAADLEHATFDSQTTWPPDDRLPPGFDAVRVLELGKNPGLGIRKLHAQGITGHGIGIGIVDQTLLTRHSEFVKAVKEAEADGIFVAWCSPEARFPVRGLGLFQCLPIATTSMPTPSRTPILGRSMFLWPRAQPPAPRA
ncbi:MAG: hypothetical protein ABSA83_08205 [Verrucomicrobiota bacterium]